MKLSRRNFLKYSGTAIGAVSIGGITACAKHSPDWKPISYPRMALYNGHIFNGIDSRLIKDQVVLINGGTIQSIEPRGDLSGFENYRLIDLQGRTLLPGLIDNHVHITVPFMFEPNFNTIREMDDQIALNFRECVMSGVTTVRDVGGFPEKVLKFKSLADTNRIPGPKVVSSLSPIAARKGPILGAPENAPYFTNPLVKWLLGGNYAERCETVAEVTNACDRMIEKGAQLLKTLHQDSSYSYYPRALPNHTVEGYKVIIDKAANQGLKAALHAPFVSGLELGVDLGFDTMEHMPHDRLIPKGLVDQFNRKGMAMLPTILVFHDTVIEKQLLNLVQAKGNSFLTPEAVKQVTDRMQKSLGLYELNLSKQERKHLKFDPWYIKDKIPNMFANLKRLYDMGAKVGVGSDMGGSYLAYFNRYVDELKHYAAAGIPVSDVLQMATRINADILGMGSKLGTLEKGKQADFVAVRGNPLENLAALEQVDLVIKDGAIIKAKDITT